MADYTLLVRLFMEPLLGDPRSLQIDCELTCGGKRIWLRVAFDNEDRGRVYGRGGRTIQAIKQVLGMAAQLAGQRLHLDVYDPNAYVPRREY